MIDVWRPLKKYYSILDGGRGAEMPSRGLGAFGKGMRSSVAKPKAPEAAPVVRRHFPGQQPAWLEKESTEVSTLGGLQNGEDSMHRKPSVAAVLVAVPNHDAVRRIRPRPRQERM